MMESSQCEENKSGSCMIHHAVSFGVVSFLLLWLVMGLYCLRRRKLKALADRKVTSNGEMNNLGDPGKASRKEKEGNHPEPGNDRQEGASAGSRPDNKKEILYSTVVFKNGAKSSANFHSPSGSDTTYASIQHTDAPPEEFPVYAQIAKTKSKC